MNSDKFSKNEKFNYNQITDSDSNELDDTKKMLGNLFLKMNLIGESDSFKNMLQLVRKVSQFDVGVYIQGETGVGKELIARAVHYLSDRSENPFVPVNCGAFTDELFLNEFFGHKKGAYTGADDSSRGIVSEADGGTLFLDEVDGLSQKSQGALLRFLQKYEYQSLGSSELQKVNVRVLCACNKDLYKLCSEGLFREDLLYRLDILKLEVPPLRERDGDISLLANYFFEESVKKFNLKLKIFHPDTYEALESHNWPGNIRELENYIRKLTLLFDGDIIKINSIKDICENNKCYEVVDLLEYGGFHEEKTKAINYFEKNYLKCIMTKVDGNISQAARYAKKERRTFTRLLEKHGITRYNL